MKPSLRCREQRHAAGPLPPPGHRRCQAIAAAGPWLLQGHCCCGPLLLPSPISRWHLERQSRAASNATSPVTIRDRSSALSGTSDNPDQFGGLNRRSSICETTATAAPTARGDTTSRSHSRAEGPAQHCGNRWNEVYQAAYHAEQEDSRKRRSARQISEITPAQQPQQHPGLPRSADSRYLHLRTTGPRSGGSGSAASASQRREVNSQGNIASGT
jgi:hypothetical protein